MFFSFPKPLTAWDLLPGSPGSWLVEKSMTLKRMNSSQREYCAGSDQIYANEHAESGVLTAGFSGSKEKKPLAMASHLYHTLKHQLW